MRHFNFNFDYLGFDEENISVFVLFYKDNKDQEQKK